MTEREKIEKQKNSIRPAIVEYLKGCGAKTPREIELVTAAFLSGAGKVSYNTGQEVLWKSICELGQEYGYEQS